MVRSLHESDDQLELYALDRLADDAVERVEEHLIACDSCRVRLEDVGVFAHTMRQTLRTLPVLKTPRRAGWFAGWQLRFAFTGAVAFALVLAFFATRNAKTTLPPLASITLTAMRGATAVVPPARQFDLQLADAASGKLRNVEVVDSAGKAVWSGTSDGSGTTAHVRITRELPSGTYFVRLSGAGGELLHEYGFEVR